MNQRLEPRTGRTNPGRRRTDEASDPIRGRQTGTLLPRPEFKLNYEQRATKPVVKPSSDSPNGPDDSLDRPPAQIGDQRHHHQPEMPWRFGAYSNLYILHVDHVFAGSAGLLGG